MIDFRCTCHHLFTVNDDETGSDIQCPDCGRLNTVPSAAELSLLDDDGNYKVDAPVGPEVPNAEREEELKYIFQKARVDAYGNEIDLRSHANPLDYQRVGVQPIDILPEGDKPAAPKYDPETGELIRPMEVRKDPMQNVRRVLPPQAGPRRKTRVSMQRLSRVAPHEIWLKMFKPNNLIVLALFVLFQVFYCISLVVGTYLIFALPVALVIALAIIAHFGNVIDETGPACRDELPRPLRNLGWSEDLWGPFWAWIVSAVICYWPANMVLSSSIPNALARVGLAGALAALGTIFAPAIILITQTSGTFVNLRPDRILNTVRGCWPIYPLLLLLYLISVPTFVFGFVGVTICCSWFGRWSMADIAKTTLPPPPAPWMWLGCLAAITVGMWLMHYFCWVLGHTYRVYHKRFQWAYQGSLGDDSEPEPRAFEVIKAPPAPKKVPAVQPAQVLPLSEPPAPHISFANRADGARP